VLVALLSNFAVALAKAAGGLMSGAPALLAEAAHSVADTTNQGFLLLSIGLANREPTPDQPFGYARQRFLWTFIAAVAMFLAGAVFAVGIGLRDLLAHARAQAGLATYIPLAVSAVAEGASLVRALRQTREEAATAHLSLPEYIRGSRDPNVKMVLFEDLAAVIGIALAIAGIVTGEITGSSIPDPVASIAIGLLLIVVAILMGRDVSELLIGSAARPEERRAIADTIAGFDEIAGVFEVLTMVLGPNSLLVAARVDFAAGLDDARVERASDAIEARLREVVPDVTEVFLDATTAPRPSRGRRR
jgi:cation diffusion facilitator family transporter